MKSRGSMTLDSAIIMPIIIFILMIFLSVFIKTWIYCENVNDKLDAHSKKWVESFPGKKWGGVNDEIR